MRAWGQILNSNNPTTSSNKFERLFCPRAIAIVGATDDAVRPGGQTVNSLKEFGYKGKIYPVNPRHKEILGFRCYESLAAIGEPVDVAVIAVPAESAVERVRECGELGIPYAVVLGGGFREIGAEGIARQNKMMQYARAHGVRIIGPNCLGFVNIHERVYAAFGSVARPPLLAPGGVSMVMQSGGFGNSLAMGCHVAGIGFRVIIASGVEADLTAPELIDALVDDPETETILAYLEGVSDGRALIAAAERALAAGKPILVWKAGNTRQGARVAATHTANMTGSYDVWRAAMRQSGMIELHDIDQAADYIKALRPRRYPRGRNVAVISPSGGSAVAFSDAADAHGLSLPKPAAQTTAVLRAALKNPVSLDNPFDLGAGGVSERTKDQFQTAVDVLLRDDEMHQLCLMFPTLIGNRAIAGASVLAEAAKHTDKPMLVFWSMPRSVAPSAFEALEAAQIPILGSPLRVARAAAVLADYAALRRNRAAAQKTPRLPAPALDKLLSGAAGTLDEARSKLVISALGIGVTRDVTLAPGAENDCDKIALEFPVAVKVLSPDIAHKTDVGGVELNIKDRSGLKAAAQNVAARARSAQPNARIEGVLVSEMVVDAVEVIVGAINDPVFGPVVLLGMGGVLAEALHDVAYRIAPFGLAEAQAMIGELRTSCIFEGMRGKPPCDVAALADALVKISQFAWDCRDRISELDINPLMVRPRGRGVVAADALVVLR